MKEILVDFKDTPNIDDKNEEKKKRRITFNDENNIIYETPNTKNISEIHSQRSFAADPRKFSLSTHKKLKTEVSS